MRAFSKSKNASLALSQGRGGCSVMKRKFHEGVLKIFRYSTATEPLHCVYKFDYDKYSGTFSLKDDNSPVGEVNRHKFNGKL